MSLREYSRKRDFSRTREPIGRAKKKKSDGLRFVIQKHDASRLHYDFRLEMNGMLKSWAVPKGIPYAKGEKHLAVQVEDHPLDYADFEGIIPEGQYGGGAVMVWDTGHYEPLSEHPAKDLAAGKLHFLLHGTKLEGEWALIRIKSDEGKNWLLFKSGKEMNPLSKKRDDQSALSGRGMARIARDRDAEWKSRPKNGHKPRPRLAPKSDPAPAIQFLEPMKAKPVAEPPQGRDWLYELKFDGFRALAFKKGAHVDLLSRNGKDLGARFPEIVEAVASLAVTSAVFDGEVVALDESGRSSFQMLQGLDIGATRPAIAYYLFDLLREGRSDLRSRTLADRKRRLEEILRDVEDPIHFSANITGDPLKLLAEVRARGLEGIIGKQRDSVYESGRRSGAWIKVKCVNEQEFVIGGYTAPRGTRKHFGAVLVGYFENGKLLFAGKVGTGFNEALLGSLHSRFARLERSSCPFANLPEKKQGRWSQNITPAEMRHCTWIEPRLISQVRFTEWTSDGKLRHPAFYGLRDDKKAAEVIRERAA